MAYKKVVLTMFVKTGICYEKFHKYETPVVHLNLSIVS